MSASGIPPFQLFPSANVLGIVPAVSYPGRADGRDHHLRHALSHRRARRPLFDRRHAVVVERQSPVQGGPALRVQPDERRAAGHLLPGLLQLQLTDRGEHQPAQHQLRLRQRPARVLQPVSGDQPEDRAEGAGLHLGMVRPGHVETDQEPDARSRRALRARRALSPSRWPDRRRVRAGPLECCPGPAAVHAGDRQRHEGRLRSAHRPGGGVDLDRISRPGLRRRRQRHGHRQGAAAAGRTDVHALEAARDDHLSAFRFCLRPRRRRQDGHSRQFQRPSGSAAGVFRSGPQRAGICAVFTGLDVPLRTDPRPRRHCGIRFAHQSRRIR